jgi:CRISPR-associated protein Cmr6
MASNDQFNDSHGSKEKASNPKGAPNLGLLYYKTPFLELADEDKFNHINKEILKTLSSQSLNSYAVSSLDAGGHFSAGAPTDTYEFMDFELVTNYPGLTIGLGYSHSTGKSTEEFKLGFFFDHTTGLPTIPGSSIKGRLRSFFPGRYEGGSKRQKEVGEHLLKVLEELKNKKLIQSGISSKEDLVLLEQTIFEGSNLKGKGALIQDTFFDAFPVHSANQGGKFLSPESITPHDHPLHEPNPLRILKVLPGVRFRFQFRLNNAGGLQAKEKMVLFQYLLQEYGMGAKTASGFGQFRNARALDNLRSQVKGQDGYIASFAPAATKSRLSSDTPSQALPQEPPKKETKLGPDEAIATLIGADPKVPGKKLFRLETQEGAGTQEVSIRYYAEAEIGRKAVLQLQRDKKTKSILNATLKKWLD